MNLLPEAFVPLILTFAPLFSQPVWKSAMVMLVGAIPAPGKRTVSALLRVMGLHQEQHFQTYHRVLSRAVWSSRQASRVLLQQLWRMQTSQMSAIEQGFWQYLTFKGNFFQNSASLVG